MSLLNVNDTTIDDIANWAVTKLNRVDLLSDAREAALSFYQLLCHKVPFDSLRDTVTAAFFTNQANYSINDYVSLTELSQVAGICSVQVTANGTSRRLRRSHIRVYDSLGTLTTGIPSIYARWGGYLYFNPTPASTYPWQVRYWKAPPITRTGGGIGTTILFTPPEWDELLKWETYYRMLIHTDQFEKAQALVNPMPMPRQAASKKTIMFETAIIPRLWNDLLVTVEQRENVDEDFSMNPMVRAYTNVR